jgi:hypothetical protein
VRGGYGWKISEDGRALALLRPLDIGPCLQHSGVLSRIGTRPARRSAPPFGTFGRPFSFRASTVRSSCILGKQRPILVDFRPARASPVLRIRFKLGVLP